MPPTAPLTLHQHVDSGNSYKIRLTAALIDLPIASLENYNALAGETRTQHFLENVNKNGKVPTLQIGKDKFLPESNAASYFLATGSPLIPTDPFEHAQMLQWMFFEQYSHEPYVATLRIWISKIGEKNLSELQKALLPGHREKGRAALALMNEHLRGREWFVGERVTVCDVCLYAYTHMLEQGGFKWSEFPEVKAWCGRIEKLPGYISIDQ